MRLKFLYLILLLISAGAAAEAQEPEPIERLVIDTRLVSVPVIVSDRTGHYVPNLRPQNFKLYDNNVEQKIEFFDAAEEPLNVALLLDTSRSTRGVLADIRSAAREFLRALRPKDRAMIVSFDKDVEQLSPLTSDHRVLEKAISRAVASQYFGTLLNDAVAKTSSTFLQTVNGRKAIVLLTDGEDGGSQTGAKELLAQESEADAMIYPIYYEAFLHDSAGMFSGLRNVFGKSEKKTPLRLKREAEAAEYLTKLADVSGGRFFSSSATNLRNAFDLIARELRYQYRLGFYPAAAVPGGSLRPLKVRVDRQDVSIRARKNYRTPPAP